MRRILRTLFAVLLLGVGVGGAYWAWSELYRSLEVHWWHEGECVVEARRMVEVEGLLGSVPHRQMRLTLRDVETGRVYPNSEISRPPPEAGDPYDIHPHMARYGVTERVPCRISPDGRSAVAEPASLLVPFFLALGILFSLVPAGIGLVGLFPSLLEFVPEFWRTPCVP